MLEFYKYYTTTYVNNKEIRTKYCGICVKDYQPENYCEKITWDNLKEKYELNGLNYPFNIWNFKKGRRISFFNSFGEELIKDIKEWKTPLDIEVKHEYILYNPSIDYILKYPDGAKAIQYLIERGITIMGK